MHRSLRHAWPFPIPTCRIDPSTAPNGAIRLKPKRFGCSSHLEPRAGQVDLAQWQATVESLKHRYPRERELNKVPLQLAEGRELYLTPGNHSRLIRAIVEEFAPGLPLAVKSFTWATPAKNGLTSTLMLSEIWVPLLTSTARCPT